MNDWSVDGISDGYRLHNGPAREPCIDRKYWNILACLLLNPKPVAELIDEEKFAICFTAGVPMDWHYDGERVIISTSRKCGIVLDGGNYHVCIKADE